MTKVAVVILNWNGKLLLEQFIPILLKYTPSEVDIVVGDNSSSDGSIEFIQSHFPKIRTIVNPENLGYAGGYNKVLEQVEAEYYVLLNSDVEVSPNWLNPIIHFLDQNLNIVAAQPKILSYYHKDLFEYAGAAGGYMDCLGYFFCRGRLFDTLEKDLGQYNDIQTIFWASGAAFFIRSQDFHEAGGFDASLFAHMEEIDLCWRLQRKGKEIAYIPEGTVYHMGGQTLKLQNSKKTYLNFRNNLIILYKNLDAQDRLRTLFLRFLMDFITWVYFLATLRWNHAWAINKAHYDFIRMFRLYPCQRKERNRSPVVLTSLLPGYFDKSLVWAYYIEGKKKFSELF
jgi:GT2 family glycosyltransferase